MHLPTFSYWLPLSIILLLSLYSPCITDEIRDSVQSKNRKGIPQVIGPVFLPVKEMKLFRVPKRDSVVLLMKKADFHFLPVHQVIVPAPVDTIHDPPIEHPQVPITESAHIIEYVPQISPMASISGIVIDKETRQLLEGANIRFNKHKIGTKTDSLGRFIATDVPEGNQILWISMVGYETARIGPFKVRPFSAIILTVNLPQSIFRLKREVTVTGIRKGICFDGCRRRYYFNKYRRSIIEDSETGLPLFEVFIYDVKNHFGDKSDIHGHFRFGKVSSGANDLRFTCSGYDTLMIRNVYEYKNSPNLLFPIEMHPAPDSRDRRRFAADSLKWEMGLTDRERLLNAHRQKIKNSRP